MTSTGDSKKGAGQTPLRLDGIRETAIHGRRPVPRPWVISSNHARLDDAATTSRARVAAGRVESSGTIALRVAVWLMIREATVLPTTYVLCLLVKHTHI